MARGHQRWAEHLTDRASPLGALPHRLCSLAASRDLDGVAGMGAIVMPCLWGGSLPYIRGDDDRSYDHGLGLCVDAETVYTMKRLLQGQDTSPREGGLVGAGLLMQESTVLVEAVTMGLPSGGDFFQQRHIKQGFLLLLPFEPPTRHRVCAPHRPARIGTKGRNDHIGATAF